MLRYSPDQIEALLANRRTFNNNERSLAERLGLNNGASHQFVGNASPLPREVWSDWDRESVELQREILAIHGDLAASVAHPLSIGKLIQYFRTVTDSSVANISLDGQSEAKTDQPEYDYHGTPVPIVDSTYSFGWRQMMAAQTEGEDIDGDARDNSNRRVAEKSESIVLDGDTNIVVGGSPLYGFRNHPKRNTRSTGVTLNGATGAQWVAEFKAILALLHADNFKLGDFTFYMNFSDWFYASNTDYSTAYPGKTILQRVMEIAGVGKIVVSDKVAANEVIAIKKDRRVVRLLNAMPQSTIALFRANVMDPYNFKVLAASALQIKYDAEDNCGVAHSS